MHALGYYRIWEEMSSKNLSMDDDEGGRLGTSFISSFPLESGIDFVYNRARSFHRLINAKVLVLNSLLNLTLNGFSIGKSYLALEWGTIVSGWYTTRWVTR